jgi:hypothetical protein
MNSCDKARVVVAFVGPPVAARVLVTSSCCVDFVGSPVAAIVLMIRSWCKGVVGPPVAARILVTSSCCVDVVVDFVGPHVVARVPVTSSCCVDCVGPPVAKPYHTHCVRLYRHFRLLPPSKYLVL